MQSQSKECKKCNEIKSTDSFAKASRRKDGLQPWCRECVATRDRERYLNDKKKHRSWNTKRRDKYYDMVTAYLHEHPCVDCGEPDIVVLEFDHVRGKKLFTIGAAAIREENVEKLDREIKKCEVRCCNCHKRKTAKERNYWYI